MTVLAAPTSSVDLRPLPRPERHALVFRRFEALTPGEAFELVNDHDPLGLLRQFHALLPGTFTWDYRLQGPKEWRVVIGRMDHATSLPDVGEPGCACGGRH